MSSFRLRPEAESDLETIWLYTEQNWGIEQAHAYIDGMVDIFQLLSNNPLMCPERSEFTPAVRIHHHAYHLVVFVLSDAGIDVVRILHESMDIDTQLTF
ncbi:type II toxin-antitoxin system RelE/ParE family toxin [Alkalimarinus alittae]|uniref:Toxin n=1 Tax=Alkalimarinus alittae TaxID=2961619 RepID=A0ABY6N2K9_9ALTE|nr:type II toxin-antitoxin system RelE/ParE family toxin [Alkalimarinus alittae]UZE96232.1 type II toxin-antitoxin system RelE/ParE family toxin [Alkalimarinus alittae]